MLVLLFIKKPLFTSKHLANSFLFLVNKILSKFKYNLSKYPIFYSNFYNYIEFFYIKKNQLGDFFIDSFNWRFSPEGEGYWCTISRDFCNYIKENIYYDDCWSD